MVCFSMAVISAFIGAKGLGFNLLLALNQLNIGLALEAGLCISLIAILLDLFFLRKDLIIYMKFHTTKEYQLQIFGTRELIGFLIHSLCI